MRLINSFLLTVIFLLVSSVGATAQTDFLKKAKESIAAGNYSSAKNELAAHKAYLDSKKVDRNSNSYIDVERMLKRVTDCQPLMEKALSTLSTVTSEAIVNEMDQARDTSEISVIAKKYLSRLSSARANLKKVSVTFPSDRKAKAKLVEVDKLVELVKDEKSNFAEKGYWEEALRRNDREGYAGFLRKFPKGRRVDLARKAIRDLDDEEAWKAVETKDDLEAYLKSFPSGLHVDDAKVRLNDIDDFEAWSQAESTNTAASFKAYISKYPQGKHVDEARNGLAKLEERNVWEETQRVNTIQAYKDYLSKSKSKSYEREAKKAIVYLELEQKVAADNKLWNSIKSSDNPNDFKSYLSSSSYRDPKHEQEAKFRYNILNAESNYKMKAYSEAVKSFERAKAVMPFTKEYVDMYLDAREEMLYSEYSISPSVEKAKTYLKAFPDGKYSYELSGKICRNLADAMNGLTTNKEYQQVLLYAKTDSDRKYVSDCYDKIQKDREKNERRLNRKNELFHMLLGVEGLAQFYFKEVAAEADETISGEDSWKLTYADYYAVAPMVSFGGRSNRFNLEAGYDFINNQVIARPRLNLVKKHYYGPKLGHRRGSNYSVCALYLAPEAFIDVKNMDNTHYGVRGGMSIYWFDIFGGYKFQDNRLYFGIGLYFGNK